MKPGTKPTIRTVAALAGVSLTTVSYVLSGRTGGTTRISEPTREKVLTAVKELGYVPNQAARGMRRGRTDLVAVSVGNLEWPWDRGLADAAQRILPEFGFQPVVLLGVDAWRQFMLSGGADGVILGNLPESVERDETMLELARRGVPQVVVSELMRPLGFDVLAPLPEPGILAATEYLAHRHKRIGVLRRAEDSELRLTRPRYSYFVDGMEAAGRVADPSLVRITEHNKLKSYELALELLSLPDRPTALFCTDDMEALAALRAAHRLGISVPDELEILGTGNSTEGQECDPPLSTVGPAPIFDDVITMLLTRLNEGGAPVVGERRMSPWSLWHRGTTRG
ncbi:MAG: LacI family transcriptional regulator [Acidobacteria bacterium]|nr:LacI family transcriptional regulator [Acidobacteriota bacterium]